MQFASHMTLHAWEAMGRELETLKEAKQSMEIKIARLEKLNISPPRLSSDKEDELHTEIGRLRYQNEKNKTQKAAMACKSSQKDIGIKQLQLDLDGSKEALERAESAAAGYAEVVGNRDYLQEQRRDSRINSSHLLSDSTEVKNREIQALTQQQDRLEDAVARSKEN